MRGSELLPPLLLITVPPCRVTPFPLDSLLISSLSNVISLVSDSHDSFYHFQPHIYHLLLLSQVLAELESPGGFTSRSWQGTLDRKQSIHWNEKIL